MAGRNVLRPADHARECNYHGMHLMGLLHIKNGIWDYLGELRRRVHFPEEGLPEFGLIVEHRPLNREERDASPYLSHAFARIGAFRIPRIPMNSYSYWMVGESRQFDLYRSFAWVRRRHIVTFLWGLLYLFFSSTISLPSIASLWCLLPRKPTRIPMD